MGTRRGLSSGGKLGFYFPTLPLDSIKTDKTSAITELSVFRFVSKKMTVLNSLTKAATDEVNTYLSYLADAEKETDPTQKDFLRRMAERKLGEVSTLYTKVCSPRARHIYRR